MTKHVREINVACQSAPPDNSSETTIITPFHPIFHAAVPAGLETYAKRLQHVVDSYCSYSSKHDNTGRQSVHPCPPILLIGPSGCGRNTLAASLCRRPFAEISFKFTRMCMPVECLGDTVAVTCAKIKSKLSKLSSAAAISASIREERRRSVTILYLDAIDCFFTNNNDGRQRIIDQLLSSIKDACLEGSAVHSVIVIASYTTQTTAHYMLDPDLSATFVEKIHFSPLTVTERTDAFTALAKYYGFVDRLLLACDDAAVTPTSSEHSMLNTLLSMTNGYYLSDCVALVKRMVIIESQNITKHDLIKFIRQFNNNINNSSIQSSHIPETTWSDVGGLDTVRRDIIDAVRMPLLFPAARYHSSSSSGMLLYGPPGNGKTLIVKATANELNVQFISVKGPELLSMYVGQSEQNVREVFARARQAAAPCIIFFDELDALAPNRGNNSTSGGGVVDRVVSQLLAELDGLVSGDIDEQQRIFVIGATNRPELIEPALLRPGRLGRQIYIGNPRTRADILQILTARTRRLELSPSSAGVASVNEMLEKIVDTLLLPVHAENDEKSLSTISGADIGALCSNACVNAIKRIGTTTSENMTTTIDNNNNNDQQKPPPSQNTKSLLILVMQDFELAAQQLKFITMQPD